MITRFRALHIFAPFVLTSLAASAAAQVAVRGGVVHTVSGAAIKDGVVVITDGKIAAVGPRATTPIPAGYKVLEAPVVTPGLIDARCTVGVSGLYNSRGHDQDQLETSAAIQPELRAIDAYNPQDALVEYVRSYGVTTIQTGHAPGEVVSGQLAIFKTVGKTVEEAVVTAESAVATTISPMAFRGGGSPGTRAKMIAMVREQLIKAQKFEADRLEREKKKAAGGAEPAGETDEEASRDGEQKSDSSTRDLKFEVFGRVLRREVPLVVTANRAQDIHSVLRLAEEFNIRVILDSGSEAALLADEIKKAGVDVLVHPTMARAYGEMENKSFETASALKQAGVRVAIEGGFEDYVPKARVVLFEAGVAAANGLGMEGALAAVTLDAARIIGVDQRVGSIEVGKDGDLAMYSGDPFEYTTTCTGVIINGEVVVEKGR